jgi:hypothetical protein
MLQARLGFAALLALLVLVNGCSSEGDEPVQAGPASSPTETPNSAPTASPSVDEFAFPADVKLEFETPPTGDEVEDAVLEAWMNFEKSIVKAALSKSWSDRTFFKYSDVPVRLIIGDYLERKRAANTSVIGTRRFFDMRAEPSSDNIFTIISCRDDTLFYGRNLRTGKAELTTPSKEDFSAVTAGLVRRGKKWILATYNVAEGEQSCVQ